MIIARYITKEIFVNFITITGILLLIAVSNRFAVYLTKAATGELPVGFVFTVVGYFIPELLSILIPLGFFLSLLFVYGRLYADSEMTVLQACGVSWRFISFLTLSLAALIMVLNGWLTLSVVPKLSEKREAVLSEGEAVGVFQTMLPGRFQTFLDGRLVFYLEDVASKENSLKRVFIAETPLNAQPHKEGFAFMVAKEARIEQKSDTKELFLVLNEGHRYQGMLGAADYMVIKFDQYGRTIPQKKEIASDTLRMKGSSALWNSKDKADQAELQWRLSIPISILLLALLALSLSKVRPRQGRFAKFLPALVVYIVYYNLFTVSKRWVAQDTLSTHIGVWWVHVLLLVAGLVLLAKESGWWKARRYAYHR